MNKAFIIKPHFYDLYKLQIHYTDILTYVAIRSFLNNRNKRCNPAYITIGKKMGASKKFVERSIKRLMKTSLLNVFKSDKARVSNRYEFSDIDKFHPIPPEILSETDIGIHEKAMLLLLRQYCIGAGLDVLNSYKELAEQTGLSYKIIHQQVESLVAKGYLHKKERNNNPVKHLKFSERIDWHYQFKESKEVITESFNFILC